MKSQLDHGNQAVGGRWAACPRARQRSRRSWPIGPGDVGVAAVVWKRTSGGAQMRVVIIYESMYGNTHAIADAIAQGLEPGNRVSVVPVAGASEELLNGADLVVVGGPTHVHGMSRASTRKSAVEQAHKSGGPALEAGVTADGPGLRDWFGSLGQISAEAAAFDTRLG